MKFAKMAGASLLAGSIALAFAVPTTAAPLMTAQSALSAPSSMEMVQYRGHWHGPRHHYYRNDAGAIIGGLAAGAIIGGAIAASQANAAANAAAQQHVDSCYRRYRSYDPASNTFLARDGNRYPCR